jgi:hypothetical protein
MNQQVPADPGRAISWSTIRADRPGRELWRWFSGLVANQTRWLAGQESSSYSSRNQSEQVAASGAACPFHQCRCSKPVCICRRFGTGQSSDLQTRSDHGALTANSPSFGALNPVRPRHFAFHPSGKSLTSSTKCTARSLASPTMPRKANSNRNKRSRRCRMDLMERITPPPKCRFIRAKILYGSNRGHHSIAVFSIDETTGKLTTVGINVKESKHQKLWCRPDGKFVIVANQDGASLVVM